MLAGLWVKNFKSIEAAGIRFGPLTCFVGRNGVGKSNLFDAICFLSRLAERDTSGAAVKIRQASGQGFSPLDLVFGRDPKRLVELSADMIVPAEVTDDFGVPAKPSTTLLTYRLKLRYAPESDRLLVESESLTHAKLGDFKRFARFPSSDGFKSSVALGSRRGGPLISTEDDRIILHGDGGSRARSVPAGRSPLTVVGGTNASSYPTVLAARREMSSWRVLHLEPRTMRRPDARWVRPRHVSASGGRIPATLHALMARDPDTRSELLHRLGQLTPDVADLDAFVDEVGGRLDLRARVAGVDGWLHAHSLSDTTLRYIALSLMLVDVHDRAVLCIEEPENGIHPSRIPNLVELLRDYAVDTRERVALDNPLRQIVINSHSPEVARQLSFDDIVFVKRSYTGGSDPISAFRPVVDTWRADLPNGKETAPPISRTAVADFIGGSPVGHRIGQLKLHFGTAR